jgi:hypothetical protein
MQTQRIALWRWIRWHRYQLATGSALALVAALLVILAPGLLAVGALEWKYSRRPSRLLSLALLGLLVHAVVWLWHELRGLPHGPWHPCIQCGAPIEAPSRAWYCSPWCRRYAHLERDARSFDPWVAEQAETRLRAIAEPPELDPELSEIPF